MDVLIKIAKALDVPVSSLSGSTDRSPLDAEARRRIERSLQDLLALMPTISRSELRERILCLIAPSELQKD